MKALVVAEAQDGDVLCRIPAGLLRALLIAGDASMVQAFRDTDTNDALAQAAIQRARMDIRDLGAQLAKVEDRRARRTVATV